MRSAPKVGWWVAAGEIIYRVTSYHGRPRLWARGFVWESGIVLDKRDGEWSVQFPHFSKVNWSEFKRIEALRSPRRIWQGGSGCDSLFGEREVTETEIQSQILKALRSIPTVSFWRSNVDMRGRYKKGRVGQADITGLVKMIIGGKPYGIRVEIEVKTDTGKQSPEQEAFQREVEELGGVYILARSVDDVLAGLGLSGGGA